MKLFESKRRVLKLCLNSLTIIVCFRINLADTSRRALRWVSEPKVVASVDPAAPVTLALASEEAEQTSTPLLNNQTLELVLMCVK